MCDEGVECRTLISTRRAHQFVADTTLRLVAGLVVMVPGLDAQSAAPEAGLGDTFHISSEAPGIEWQAEEAASNHLVSGLIIGAGVGVVGGLVLYEIGTSGRCDPADNTEFYTCTLGGPNAVESAVIVGAIGALIGGVVGMLIPASGLSVHPYIGGSSRLGISIGTAFPKRLP